MPLVPRRRLALALLGGVLLAPSWAAALPEPRITIGQGPPPIALALPADGAVLTAGSTARLAWEPGLGPLAGTGPFAGFDEWEVFLSVDGGASYPVRITPHLDADLRQALWEVPDLPTRDARLLLRVGDEHRETAFALPQRFTIAAADSPAATAATFQVSFQVSFHRGEPALPGHPGVVSWVEGSRRGTAARQVVAVETAGLDERGAALETRHGEAFTVAEGGSLAPPALQAGARLAHPSSAVRRRAAAAAPTGRPPADLLLLLRRRNE